MKLLKDHRSGAWKVRMQTQFGPRTISTRTKDREQAKRVVEASNIEDLETAARIGNLTSQAVSRLVSSKAVNMAQAAQDWKAWLLQSNRSSRTAHNYSQNVAPFVEEKSTTPPSLITDNDIRDWINRPGEMKLSTRTVALAAMRSLFTYCSIKGWCSGNVALLVEVRLSGLTHNQKDVKKRVPFTDDEIDRLVAQTDPGSFWRFAILCARYTGLRLGDICQLEWACFQSPGVIRVWMDKTDNPIEMTLSPDVSVAMVKKEDDTYLFPAERNTVLDPGARSSLSSAFSRLCRKAGIEGKSFHSLRCSFAVAQQDKGADITVVSRSLGHSNVETTRRYVA